MSSFVWKPFLWSSRGERFERIASTALLLFLPLCLTEEYSERATKIFHLILFLTAVAAGGVTADLLRLRVRAFGELVNGARFFRYPVFFYLLWFGSKDLPFLCWGCFVFGGLFFLDCRDHLAAVLISSRRFFAWMGLVAFLLIACERWGFRGTATVFCLVGEGAVLLTLLRPQTARRLRILGTAGAILLTFGLSLPWGKGLPEGAFALNAPAKAGPKANWILRETASQGGGLPQHILYEGNEVVFKSSEEQAKYGCLSGVAFSTLKLMQTPNARVLVLGGGDGLLLRHLVTHPRIKQITLVEPREPLLHLAASHPKLRMYHLDSMRDPKVFALEGEIADWLAKDASKYDLVFFSFPSPSDRYAFRNFTEESFSRILKSLDGKGHAFFEAGPLFVSPESQALSPVSSHWVQSLQKLGVAPRRFVSSNGNSVFLWVSRSPTLFFDDIARVSQILPGSALRHSCLSPGGWQWSPGTAQNYFSVEWMKSIPQEEG